METLALETQSTLDQWRLLLEQILSAYAKLPYRYGEISTYPIISQDRNHFLLMHEGWENQHRIHGCLVHAEIRNQKIWIHYDGIEDSITEELVRLGVPKTSIVLAFHSLEVRQHTGYAVS